MGAAAGLSTVLGRPSKYRSVLILTPAGFYEDQEAGLGNRAYIGLVECKTGGERSGDNLGFGSFLEQADSLRVYTEVTSPAGGLQNGACTFDSVYIYIYIYIHDCTGGGHLPHFLTRGGGFGVVDTILHSLHISESLDSLHISESAEPSRVTGKNWGHSRTAWRFSCNRASVRAVDGTS